MIQLKEMIENIFKFQLRIILWFLNKNLQAMFLIILFSIFGLLNRNSSKYIEY